MTIGKELISYTAGRFDLYHRGLITYDAKWTMKSSFTFEELSRKLQGQQILIEATLTPQPIQIAAVLSVKEGKPAIV